MTAAKHRKGSAQNDLYNKCLSAFEMGVTVAYTKRPNCALTRDSGMQYMRCKICIKAREELVASLAHENIFQPDDQRWFNTHCRARFGCACVP